MPFRKKHLTDLKSLLRKNEPNRSHINQVVEEADDENKEIPYGSLSSLINDEEQPDKSVYGSVRRFYIYTCNKTPKKLDL